MTSTASRNSNILGAAALVGVGVLLFFAFVVSPPDERIEPITGQTTGQFDAVRLMYVHVPIALTPYVLFGICALASIMVLWKRSTWWDVMAHASAEVGVVFGALTLATGMIWGRPVWGTWWEWGDVRLMTSLILFLTYVGYLALRRIPSDPAVGARRAAVVGISGMVLLPIVNRSVEWWENRTLHQQSTLQSLQIEDMTLFTLVLGIFVFALIGSWLLLVRFRVGWLEHQRDRVGLDDAIAQRRAEAEVGVDAAVGRT